jgi:hypothetical protein
MYFRGVYEQLRRPAPGGSDALLLLTFTSELQLRNDLRRIDKSTPLLEPLPSNI